MLRSSAIYLVVVIALLIAALSSSLVLIAFHYQSEVRKNLILQQLNLNNASALLLISTPDFPYGEQVLDLYNRQTDSVHLKKSCWGVYTLGFAEAVHRPYTRSKTVLQGYAPGDDQYPALYLADAGEALSVEGTTLKGALYLPAAGIRNSYLQGHGGKNTLTGERHQSTSVIPDAEPVILAELYKTMHQALSGQGEDVLLLKDGVPDSLIRSFKEPCLLAWSDAPVYLTGVVAKQNVILSSASSVHIRAGCQLEDVLIFAPYIQIDDGFTGSVQLFASDSIHIGNNCKLIYPSVAGLTGTLENYSHIRIGNSTHMSGMIFSCATEKASAGKSLITLNEQVKVIGQVYADGRLDLKGTVYGSVICHSFYYRSFAGTYTNQLLNAVIDRTALPSGFAGTQLMPSDRKRVVKWLN